MDSEGTRTKRLDSLRKGDIVRMRIPFEENTNDYYNGYRPQDIRGELYTDRFGQTSKPRFVIVLGKEDRQIIYLPLTSRHARFDSKHQYMLQDNSMTWKKDPDMKSYVEVDSIRAVYANPEWDIQYFGQVEENDMVNIAVRLGKKELDMESKRDQRAYVSRARETGFERQLKDIGYVKTASDQTQTIYRNEEGRTVTKQKWGLVKYHVPLTKDEVKDLVAKREQSYTGDQDRMVSGSQTAEDIGFTEAVESLGKKNESEVVI